jgi:NTP pyrophosphatase (non-canonical NTP hydrolase)
MEMQNLAQRARAVRRLYAAFEQRSYGRSWTAEELALGFVGDVGDLMKLVVAREGVRAIPDAEAKLRHELADCLWSLFVLADCHRVDLEQAFIETTPRFEDFTAEQFQHLGTRVTPGAVVRSGAYLGRDTVLMWGTAQSCSSAKRCTCRTRRISQGVFER